MHEDSNAARSSRRRHGESVASRPGTHHPHPQPSRRGTPPDRWPVSCFCLSRNVPHPRRPLSRPRRQALPHRGAARGPQAAGRAVRDPPRSRARRAHPDHDRRLGPEPRRHHDRRPGRRQDDPAAEHARRRGRDPGRRRTARPTLGDRPLRHRLRHRRRRRRRDRLPDRGRAQAGWQPGAHDPGRPHARARDPGARAARGERRAPRHDRRRLLRRAGTRDRQAERARSRPASRSTTCSRSAPCR